MQNFSLTGLAFLVFGFALIFVAFSKDKMGWGTRITIGLIGLLLVPGAASMTALGLHRVLFSPFFMVPLAICVGYYVWTQIRPNH